MTGTFELPATVTRELSNQARGHQPSGARPTPERNCRRQAEMMVRALLVTMALTAAGFMLIVLKPGQGGPTLFFGLNESAVWLLPGALALAIPAGVFGGILLTRVGQPDIIDETWADDTAGLAVLALLLSALTVGWLVPLAGGQTDRAMSGIQTDTPQVELREGRTSRLTLDRLVVQMDSTPGARQELWRRAAWIAPSVLLPLVAGVLAKLRAPWTRGEAALAVVMVFMISLRLGIGN